jgi:hypothetical protein
VASDCNLKQHVLAWRRDGCCVYAFCCHLGACHLLWCITCGILHSCRSTAACTVGTKGFTFVVTGGVCCVCAVRHIRHHSVVLNEAHVAGPVSIRCVWTIQTVLFCVQPCQCLVQLASHGFCCPSLVQRHRPCACTAPQWINSSFVTCIALWIHGCPQACQSQSVGSLCRVPVAALCYALLCCGLQ